MSKTTSYQTTQKTGGDKYFNFGTHNMDMAPSRGAPPIVPFSEDAYKHTVLRLRDYDKTKINLDKESLYLSKEDQGILIDVGRKVNRGDFGGTTGVVKSSYQSLVNELNEGRTVAEKTTAIKNIINLLSVIKKEDSNPRGNVDAAVMDYFSQAAPIQPPAPIQPLRPQTGKKSKFSDAPPSKTLTEMRDAQFPPSGSKSSGSRDPPRDPPVDNTDVPPNEPITADFDLPLTLTRVLSDRSADLANKSAELIQKSASSRGNTPVRTPLRAPIRTPVGTPLREEQKISVEDPDDQFNQYGSMDDPSVSYAGGGYVANTLTQAGKDYTKLFGTDPFGMTKFQDMGGAVDDTNMEKIGKKTKQPRQPDAENTGLGLLADLLSTEAMGDEQFINNPYGVTIKDVNRQEQKQREADEKAMGYYDHQQALLNRNPAITQGGGNDVTGVGKGSQTDVELLGSDYAPASYDVYNPQSMKRSVTSRGDDRINVTINGMPLEDDNVRRTARNSGLSNEGMTPEEIVDYIHNERNERGGRLSERVGRSLMDNAVSMGSAGSGIASQIGGLIDQQRNGAGRDRTQEGLFGGDDSPWGGGDGFGQDLSNPRTLNERFSGMGMRRQGDKIDKYVNMKNKGMMYSNLMGKGVSDPSIQSIRDRKDDYIQPNGKHKGNSVNLIRQSNATSIRLNNMYMP